ncbi:helix-turn-helix transcriptional regulator [Streptosporangium nondiastaticum]|uniref:Helix-turn-helix transcriptional regulator n=1 Tax=Streptosporangium nondiastaticum TaxID=35764 RepID=A0A9X7JSH9_9ACTN|nr:LuxR C-terminal-related transcriptional regulator [Streptosporangium nondiastaticum]PSJ28814.1 helix-turn-helix transcriptional regulator [Streptosporangium nondiastaticum]
MPPTGLPPSGDGRGTTLAWSGDPLLAAKFSVPAAPRHHVSRHRLLDRVGEGARGPLTLVTGPAGAGKTALAAAWARDGEPPGPVAWLTLDTHDGAPGVFWSYVVEALGRVLPRLRDGITMPARPGSVGTSLLTRLAAATEHLSGPVVLVLDGFEKVAGRRVPAGLEFLLGHCGPLLRLVVTSRRDPLLPLHRYRAEGRLTEVRGADLAFTPYETTALLRGHGLGPGDDVAGALTRRTGGWAAGLRLCALAMQRTGDPDGFARSFAGTEQAVSGYLIAEVLDALPPATAELLLRASVLDRLHPDLVDALTGRRDAEAVLAGLTRENAFVDPVPGTPWCRVHPLFTEVLRGQLRIRHPRLVPRLHARAARWLAGEGLVTEALEHAAQAGDWQYGASEAVHHLLAGALFTAPGGERVERAFSRMPPSVPGAEPALLAAACRLARHDRAGCRERLAVAGRHLRQGGTEPDPEVGLTHALLRLLCEPQADEHSGEHGADDGSGPAEEAARAVSDLMGRLPPERIRARPEIEALRLHGLARSHLGRGRLAEARRLCAEAAGACTTQESLPVQHMALGLLALAESAAGALTSAEDHALRSLLIAGQHDDGPDGRGGAAFVALAAVACERDNQEVAHRRLGQALACRDVHYDPLLAAEAAVLRSRLELARGRWETALSVLPGPGTGEAPWPARRLALARAAAALARGDHEAAVDAVHGIRADGPAPLVALARAHLCAGRTDRSLRLLARAEDSPGLGLPDLVGIHLLRARAALLAGDRATAQCLLGRALDAARPELLRRPFLDCGPWLRPLLDGAGRTDPAHTRAAWLTARGDAGRPGPAQPLSSRERDVLLCVQRMMSADEIAAELSLSVNTVKTHLRSVYRKLSVSRRREAVERGRELHIL